MYASNGRAWLTPERLIRALLLQMLSSRPYLAQNTSNRRSAIDGRPARHLGFRDQPVARSDATALLPSVAGSPGLIQFDPI